MVYTPGLGSAGSARARMGISSAFVRLMRRERYWRQIRSWQLLVEPARGKNSTPDSLSEKRSTLEHAVRHVPLIRRSPYTATIGGTDELLSQPQSSFLLGDNQPGGGELSGHYENAVDGRYLRYSLTALATNSFSGPLGGCHPILLRDGRTECEFYGHITHRSAAGIDGNRFGIFGA